MFQIYDFIGFRISQCLICGLVKSQNIRELNNVLTKNMNFGVRQTVFQILPLTFSNCEIVLGTQDIPLSKINKNPCPHAGYPLAVGNKCL